MSELRQPPTETCYVVLHIGSGPSRAEEHAGAQLIVHDKNPRFTLNEDFWIDRLDAAFSKEVQEACQPRHKNVSNALGGNGLYAFVRKAAGPEKSKYEGMSQLHALIALSRLVNPTSTGDRYCAHVWHFGSANSIIYSIQYRGASPDVSLVDGKRDWLSVQDGETLKKLLPWVFNSMHPRIHRAYWNHEFAMRSYYLDVKWTLIVSGFEALMNTQESRVRRQFRERVGQLSGELGIPLTDDELNKAYTLRSELVHAQNFLFDLETVLPKTQHSLLYGKLEMLLRLTLSRCLLDGGFGDHFRDKASVEARWRL
jgi:hypothetical protein